MSQPPEYVRVYDFEDFQASNPTTPLPADQIEAEFNAIKTTSDAVRTNLALIQRDDGKIANSSVHIDSLDTIVKSLMSSTATFTIRGDWEDATAYAVGDVVVSEGTPYVCYIAHVSSGSIDTSKFSAFTAPIATPDDPGDDNKFLRASGGVGQWVTLVASMLTNVTAALQSVITAVDAAAARVALGLTTVGDAVATAASAAAARTALGATATGSSIFTATDVGTVQTLLGVSGVVAETRTALKALNTGAGATATLVEEGREGLFIWKSGDFSTLIAADTQEGVYVKANAVLASAGAWVREDRYTFNVKWFGATGDGATDDSTAIQGAIDLAEAQLGGLIFIPLGDYVIGTALEVSLSQGSGVRLTGINIGGGAAGASTLTRTASTMGAILSVAGQCHVVEHMTLRHRIFINDDSATQFGLLDIEDAVQCRFDNVQCIGGHIPIFVHGTNCADNIFDRCSVLGSTGKYSALVQRDGAGTVGAIYFRRCLFNHGFPGGNVPAPADWTGNWAATTAYSVDDIATVNGPNTGTFFLVCTVAGTSGGSSPTLEWYDTDIVDGTVTWRLLAREDLVGLLFGTGVTLSAAEHCDATGPYNVGLRISNHLSGDAPLYNSFIYCNTDGVIDSGVLIDSGTAHTVHGHAAVSGIGPNTTNGIVIGASRCIVSNSRRISAFNNGINISGGATFKSSSGTTRSATRRTIL